MHARSSSVVQSYAMPPSPELNLGDLELLHQYLTSTCVAIGQLPEITARIQITVPSLAQTYPFVMHGILAMAAVHLSRMRPSRQLHYDMLAAKHHNEALPGFRSTLQNLNEENCIALITFSKGLVWCSLASDASSNQVKKPAGMKADWLPQWFRLLHGSCQIVKASRIWIKNGPHALRQSCNATDEPSDPADDKILTLMKQLAPVSEESLCKTIIAALRESFVRASMSHHNTPFRNAINFWIDSLPDEYIELLERKEPWALIVLAHFCVLLHRSEILWFMKGHATYLLISISESLNEKQRHYIKWPCEELGIK